MFRFFPSIVLLQVILALVVYAAVVADTNLAFAAVALYILVSAFVFSFWLKTLSLLQSQDEISRHKDQFAREREELRVKAEREKLKVVKDTHKQAQKEATRTHAKANFKVGAAVAGAVGVGALLMVGQMVTLGLLTLTTAGGGLAGYIVRARQEKRMLARPAEPKPIKEALPKTKIIESISFDKSNG